MLFAPASPGEDSHGEAGDDEPPAVEEHGLDEVAPKALARSLPTIEDPTPNPIPIPRETPAVSDDTPDAEVPASDENLRQPEAKPADAAPAAEAPSAPTMSRTPSTPGPATAPETDGEMPEDSESEEPLSEPPHAGDSGTAVAKEAPPSNTADNGAAAPSTDQPAEAPADAPAIDEPPPPPVAITTELAALRDQVRRTLVTYFRQPLSTQEHTVTDAIYQCLAFGCYTEIQRGNQKVNGITNLCWNYPCGGFEPLTLCGAHVAARVGYGLQERPAQMLAIFALSRVPASYPVRVGEEVRSVADMVRYEQLACRSGEDQSLRLIALANYAPNDSWENSEGEPWSIERMVDEELEQSVVGAPEGGTVRLLALQAAVERRLQSGKPLDGAYGRAERFLEQFEAFALDLLNADGSFSPAFLASRGAARTPIEGLRSTGRILNWLVSSMPPEELGDPRIVKCVAFVNSALSQQANTRAWRNMSSQDIAALMYGVRALAMYDERVFRPADPPPSEAAEAQAAAATTSNAPAAAPASRSGGAPSQRTMRAAR
ncbi:MAG: hypothetical protein ACOY3P_15865 [Planctomycetota bacterium]